MNDMMRSAGALPVRPIDLTFVTLPRERITPPADLFDERVPIEKEHLSLFLPLIVTQQGDTYTIVDGCKRFQALIVGGQNQCACGIIMPLPDVIQSGLLRINLNRGRNLHAREKLLFIRWLKANFDHASYQRYSQGLAMTSAERHDYEKLSACTEPLVEAVMQGSIDPAIAPEMTHLSPTDAETLTTLFSSLSFSRQMQRELCEWLHEIAMFRKTSIQELIDSDDIAGILFHAALNAPQKIARLHDYVYATRFPLYAQVKKAWNEEVRKVNPDPRRVSFQASPFFEKNDLELRIRITNAQSAKDALEKLASIPADSWKGLLDPTILLKPPTFV